MSIEDKKYLYDLANAPAILSEHPNTRLFYKAFCKACVEADTFEEGDKIAVALLATQYEIMQACLSEMRHGNKKVKVLEQRKDNNQNDKKIPAILLPSYNNAYKELMAGMKEFGLTPKSRKSMKTLDKELNSTSELMTMLTNTKVNDDD